MAIVRFSFRYNGMSVSDLSIVINSKKSKISLLSFLHYICGAYNQQWSQLY